MEELSLISSLAPLEPLYHSFLGLLGNGFLRFLLSFSVALALGFIAVLLFVPSLIDGFRIWPRKPEIHEIDPEILTFQPTKPKGSFLSSIPAAPYYDAPENKISLGSFQVEQTRATRYKQDPNKQYCNWLRFSEIQAGDGIHSGVRHWLSVEISSLPDKKLDLSLFLRGFMEGDFYTVERFYYSHPDLYEAHLIQKGEDHYELRMVEKDLAEDSYCPYTFVFKRRLEVGMTG